MKLEPIAKPVRIRITSNGKEHTDLASLRENFCIDDVYKSYTEKCLVKWLRQIKEDDFASCIKDIDTRVEDEFERKFLVYLLMSGASKNVEDFKHLRSLNEEEMCRFLSQRNADDMLLAYIERHVESEVLERLIESEDPKIKSVTKIELGERYYKKAQETESGENQINLYKRAIELGHPSAYEKCLRALDLSESVINEINSEGNGISLQNIDFVSRLKKAKCSEDVEIDKLSDGFIKETAEYFCCVFNTIEEIKKASRVIHITVFDVFDPHCNFLYDIVQASKHLLSLCPGWSRYSSYEKEDTFKNKFDSTYSSFVSQAFLNKHKNAIENEKFSRDCICEMLRDLAYYSIFTE